MRNFLKYLAGLLVLVVLVVGWLGFRINQEIGKRNSENPLVWEADVAALEERTQKIPPPVNAIVFVGSSSIRLWNGLIEAMAPIRVIQQGFGGAKLHDLVYYADRLVNIYQPKAVVVFAGSNDITPGAVKPPQQILTLYQQFVAKVRATNPNLPIYYIAITPTPRRWEVWPNAQAANAVIQAYSERTAGLFYIDTGPSLMDSSGQPDLENYSFDKGHLSDKGYNVWTSIVRPRLLEDFPQK